MTFEVTDKKRDIQVKKLQLNLPDGLKLSTSGSLKMDHPNFGFDLTTELASKTGTENVKVAGTLTDNSKGDFLHARGNFGAETSLLPEWGRFQSEWEAKKEPGHVSVSWTMDKTIFFYCLFNFRDNVDHRFGFQLYSSFFGGFESMQMAFL
jgi:hypothetical protein